MRFRYRLVLLLLCLLWLDACKRNRAASPPPTAPIVPPNIFALLPDERGRPGYASITNPAGSNELTANYTAIRVLNNSTAPTPPAPIDATAVRTLFGGALDAIPADELAFRLYFNLGGTTLDAASEALLPALLQAARERRSTIVTITGHTDTTGLSRQSNYELGLQRAQAVALRLQAVGLDPASILIRSHGQDDPLAPTPPNTAEPRNRRVEVILH